MARKTLLRQKAVKELETDLAPTLTCTASEQVGHFVYVSAAGTVNRADGSSAARSDVVGYVHEKPTSTSCRVSTQPGPVTVEVEGGGTLTASLTVYLSAATPGAVTQVAPANAVPLGIAISTTQILFYRDVDKTAIEFTCTATEQVADLVYISASDTIALSDSSDNAKVDVVGWVLSKPSATTCKVSTAPGPVPASGLTPGQKVYLDPSSPGGVTTTFPATGLVVEVGFAKSTTSFIFQRPMVLA